MFIHTSLLIGTILAILMLIMSVVYLIMQNRLAESALNDSSYFNKFSLDEILSNSNVTSDYVNELLTKIRCATDKYEEAKNKIVGLQTAIKSHIAVGENLNSACHYLQERLDFYSNTAENKYAAKQALFLEMQQDATKISDFTDYLRKYGDVFTASELLLAWIKSGRPYI